MVSSDSSKDDFSNSAVNAASAISVSSTSATSVLGFSYTHMIADLLAKAEIMKVLAEIYDPILTEVPYLYDEIEYYLCEVRRHLLHPVSRGTSSDLKFGKTPSSW